MVTWILLGVILVHRAMSESWEHPGLTTKLKQTKKVLLYFIQKLSTELYTTYYQNDSDK